MSAALSLLGSGVGMLNQWASNIYNSPKNQIKRLAKAGVSPNAFVQMGNTGNMSAPAYNNPISEMYEAQEAQARTQLTQSQQVGQDLDNQLSEETNDYYLNPDRANTYYDPSGGGAAVSGRNNLAIEKAYETQGKIYGSELTGQNIPNVQAQTKGYEAGAALTREQIKKATAETANLAKQGDLLDSQLEFQNLKNEEAFMGNQYLMRQSEAELELLEKQAQRLQLEYDINSANKESLVTIIDAMRGDDGELNSIQAALILILQTAVNKM